MAMFHRINLKFLPMKLHYFVYYGAEGVILPFIPVLGEQIGVSATGVGVIFTIFPFVSLICKPLFGGIADHLQKLKIILFIFVALACGSYVSLAFIPRMHQLSEESNVEIAVSCNSNGSYFQQLERAKMKCAFDGIADDTITGMLNCYPCPTQTNSENWMEQSNNTTQLSPPMDVSICQYNRLKYLIQFKSACIPDNRTIIINATWNGLLIQSMCLTPSLFNCNMSCNEINGHPSFGNVYEAYQFWLFFLFTILACVSSAVVTSLSDAACYEVLEGKGELYGRQRMWGTIGWGFMCILTGYLNDIVTGNSSVKDYSPSFCILAALMVCDLFIVAKSNINNCVAVREPIRNVCALLTQIRVLLFLTMVFIIGALTGLHWAYFFWYMNELKAGQLMMGLSVGIQSFLGELPFFFFAGKIINKIGHVNTVNVALIFYSLRFLIYSIVYNPWIVLPVELTQGPAFGLFYAAMTSYAKYIAPPGSEATMQGTVGGVFEGLGVAVGGLLGGIGVDYYGTHETFRVAGIVASVCCVLHIIFYFGLLCRNQILREGKYKEDEAEPTENSPCIS